MFMPVVSWIQMTDLIKEGSVEIQVGKNSLRLQRDCVEVNLGELDHFRAFTNREDFFQQMKYLSDQLSAAGKTFIVKYKGWSILRLGAGCDSFVLRLLGMDHVTLGNPVALFQVFRTWGKD